MHIGKFIVEMDLEYGGNGLEFEFDDFRRSNKPKKSQTNLNLKN